MGFFKKKEKEDTKSQVQSANVEMVTQLIFKFALDRLDDMDKLLSEKQIEFDFYELIVSLFSYYLALWLSFVHKYKNDNIYEKLKVNLVDSFIAIFSDMCEKDNIDSKKYIDKFLKRLDSAYQKAINSFEDDSFVDNNYSDEFLTSFLKSKDYINLKTIFIITFMTEWVRPIVVSIPEINIIE